MRLIDADVIPYTMLYKEEWLKGTGIEKPAVWKDTIDAMPTIEAEPVRHGHIEIKAINPYDGEDCYCSECGHGSLLPDFKWCPYCGARMEVEE